LQGQFEKALESALSQAELLAAYEDDMHVALGANVADCEIALGRLSQAEARSREALAALGSAVHTVVNAGHVFDVLMLSLTLQERFEEAISVGRQARPLLEIEGSEVRLLEPLAICAAGQHRHVDAARIAGYVDEALSSTGEVRWPAVMARRKTLDAMLASASLPDVLRQHLQVERRLTRQQAFILALPDAD
jgi:hypothetical protein